MNVSIIRAELLSTYPGSSSPVYEDKPFTDFYVNFITAHLDRYPLLIKILS